jgi:hypothetical protein
MENNSDKILREKLNGIQPAFDPQAWQKMEAMLDNKKKPKAFLFWWFGSIAVVAVSATMLYFAFNKNNEHYEKSAPVNYQVRNQQPTGNIENGLNNNQSTENKGETSDESKALNFRPSEIYTETSTDKPETINKNNFYNNHQSKSFSVSKTSSSFSRKKSDIKNSEPETHIAINHEFNTVKTNSNSNLNKSSSVVSATSESQLSNLKKTIENILPENVNESIAINELNKTIVVAIDSISVKKEEEIISEKTEERLLKSQKKFIYSIGVVSTLSAAVTKNNVAHNPSYSVGIINEFMFAKRVAVSLGINYAKTSFKMIEPRTETFEIMPLEYISNITELNLPFGVKVYPVSHEKFRYYIHTGIINHIKLKETFSYKIPPVDTSTPPANNPKLNENYYPQQTNFGNASHTEASFDYTTSGTSGNTTITQTNTNDFSINNAKRYYISVFASTGVEYVLKQRYLFFAETVYFTNLQPIGIQQKRKHNIGLGCGFRVQF